ncbi:ABC1 kinase family protein [Gorillibacterium massiliense]|uniref:ABC1 kinase family protein n=1 Tax=Gorillibacterium massiliense TaxID=1280390 RepID=UPI0004B9F9B2|nr:AarF/ABC1/UbiB kinase family protein [Gorillibacterium massiliense]
MVKMRHTNRYREIIVALARHGFGYMVEDIGLLNLMSLPVKWLRKQEREENTKSMGERIRLVLEDLGPTFIKLGQLSSTRSDLIPEDVIHELQKLQDQVPPFPIEEVRHIVESEFGKPMEQVFRSFEEVPLAAASIGQVHRAQLLTGELVAVKVRRPNVDKIITLDLEILRDLAAMAEKRVEWIARFQVRSILDELSRSMQEELDYTHEGKNCDRIAEQFKNDATVLIPKVYWEHSTAKVLTMEFVEGTMLNQLRTLKNQGHDLKNIAERVVNAMFQQIFIAGFFHADPHPGNVMITKDNRIAFVDFGLTGYLNDEMKYHLSSLLIALMRKSSDAIIRAILHLGLVSEEVNMVLLRKDLDMLRDKYYNVPFADVSVAEAMRELFGVANRHHIIIPTDMTLLGKALLTMEGITQVIYPELSMVHLAEPFGRRLIRERLHPEQMTKRAWRTTAQFFEDISGLPRQASQLARLARAGKLKVEIGIPELDVLLKKMDQISNRISISIVLLSFSLIVMGLIIASSVGKVPMLLHHFPLIEVGSSVAGLMFLWVLYSIFRTGRL